MSQIQQIAAHAIDIVTATLRNLNVELTPTRVVYGRPGRDPRELDAVIAYGDVALVIERQGNTIGFGVRVTDRFPDGPDHDDTVEREVYPTFKDDEGFARPNPLQFAVYRLIPLLLTDAIEKAVTAALIDHEPA